MKINPKIEWMREFIESVDHIVETKRLKKLYVITATTEKKHKIDGILHTYMRGKNKGDAEMGLYLKYQDIVFGNDGVSVTLRPYSKLDLCRTLAHELSHLRIDPHTTNRERLEMRIHSIFLDMLDKEGYISEEEELKK